MTKNTGWALLLLSASLCWPKAWADDAVDFALRQSQDCLKNNNCPSAEDGAGKAAEEQALALTGGDAAKQQALNRIAAEILPILVQQSGGDPQKMQALMVKAQNNPEQFVQSLPPALQDQILHAAEGLPHK